MKYTAQVPTNLDRPDAFITIPLVKVGLSIRQILVIFLPIMSAAAGVTWLTYLSFGWKIALAPPAVIGGLAIGLCAVKPEGLSVERYIAAVFRYVVRPRRLVWAPGGLHKVPGVRQPRRGAMPVFWGRVKGGDVRSGGFLVRGFAVGSTDFGLASDREQQGKVDGWQQLLDAQDDQMQVLIRGEFIDIEARAVEAEVAGVNPALREASIHHAAHLRSMQGGHRRQVYIVIRGVDREALDIREDTVLMLLQPMGLMVRKLSTDEMADLLSRAAGTKESVR
jgi:hypothetical protein